MKKLILIIAFITSHNLFAAVAASTQVATSEGYVQIERLMEKDNIITAEEGSAPYNIKHVSVPVMDKMMGYEQRVIKISFGENGDSLIMSLEQAVMTENGIFKMAKDVSIKDSLIDADGNKVQIKMIAMGIYDGRMNDIAPTSNFVTENIYLANGVYLGSYKITWRLYEQGRVWKAFTGQEL